LFAAWLPRHTSAYLLSHGAVLLIIELAPSPEKEEDLTFLLQSSVVLQAAANFKLAVTAEFATESFFPVKIAENIQLAEFATKFFCAKNLLENFGYPNHTLKINTVVKLPVFYFSEGRHQLQFFLT